MATIEELPPRQGLLWSGVEESKLITKLASSSLLGQMTLREVAYFMGRTEQSIMSRLEKIFARHGYCFPEENWNAIVFRAKTSRWHLWSGRSGPEPEVTSACINNAGEVKVTVDKFFYIKGPAGEPRQRHNTYGAAEEEAKRLALKNPGEEYIILTAVAVVRFEPRVIVTKL